MRHCRGLHAKVVVGGGRALVGSANLTERGVLGRVEMSVLLDDEAPVDELRKWFGSLWNQCAAVTDDDLVMVVAAPPPAADSGVRVPCGHPGVRSTLRPLPNDSTSSPAEEQLVGGKGYGADVATVLAACEPAVRALIGELLELLDGPSVRAKTAKIKGGSIRHFCSPVNFSDMRPRKNHVRLALSVGPTALGTPAFAKLKRSRDRRDLGEISLQVGQELPGELAHWIEAAKEFRRGSE